METFWDMYGEGIKKTLFVIVLGWLMIEISAGFVLLAATVYWMVHSGGVL
jgi:uncharacterized membrane protein